MKIVFYDFGGVKNFKIKTEDFYQEINLREWEEVVLPFFDCVSLIIECDGEVIDFTEEITKIGCNEFITYD